LFSLVLSFIVQQELKEEKLYCLSFFFEFIIHIMKMDSQNVENSSLDNELINKYNLTMGEFDVSNRSHILKSILKIDNLPEGICIEPPFFCSVGSNLKLDQNVYMNYNCSIDAKWPVVIGQDTKFGPNVKIMATSGPLTIGRSCWFGGGVVITGDVTIGDGSVIGTGSFISENIPNNSVALGNPCRVIRTIDQSKIDFGKYKHFENELKIMDQNNNRSLSE